MTLGARAGVGRPIIVVILAVAATFGLVQAGAAAPAWMRQAFSAIHGGGKGRGAHGGATSAQRYVTDDGRVFVLDRDAGVTLIKFEDSPEVWALQPTHGPRGDGIYKNDVDETMLRETQMGGTTVFTAHRPDGAAAALSGPTAPIRLTTLGPVLLYQRLFQASVRVSRLAQHVISFEAPDADAASDGLIADAAFVATEGTADVAARAGGHARLARLRQVMIRPGAQAAVALRGGTLAIIVASAHGFAGRPSSERIARVLMRGH